MIEIGTSENDDKGGFDLHQGTRRSKHGEFSLQSGETLESFIGRHRKAVELISQLHVNIQGGYYSHKNPNGCVNCDAIIGWCSALKALESFGCGPSDPEIEVDEPLDEEEEG